jgi:hypothetical protein
MLGQLSGIQAGCILAWLQKALSFILDTGRCFAPLCKFWFALKFGWRAELTRSVRLYIKDRRMHLVVKGRFMDHTIKSLFECLNLITDVWLFSLHIRCILLTRLDLSDWQKLSLFDVLIDEVSAKGSALCPRSSELSSHRTLINRIKIARLKVDPAVVRNVALVDRVIVWAAELWMVNWHCILAVLNRLNLLSKRRQFILVEAHSVSQDRLL